MKSVFHRLPVTCFALINIVTAEPVGQAPETAGGTPATPPACEEIADTAKIAFLGVITSRPPRIMTDQLGLKPDEGLVVGALAPDGPASKAGLAINDLITGVNNTNIHTPQDLTKVIQSHAPGDVIHLKLIRKGEPTELDITLGSRPSGAVDAREIDNLLRKLIENRIAAGDNPKDTEQLAKKLGQLTKGGDAMEIPVGASIRVVDENGCVELKTSGDRKEIIVRDKDNKLTWSGPWNNDAEKKAAPPEVTQRFKDLALESIFESSRIRLSLPGTSKLPKPESDEASKPVERR